MSVLATIHIAIMFDKLSCVRLIVEIAFKHKMKEVTHRLLVYRQWSPRSWLLYQLPILSIFQRQQGYFSRQPNAEVPTHANIQVKMSLLNMSIIGTLFGQSILTLICDQHSNLIRW